MDAWVAGWPPDGEGGSGPLQAELVAGPLPKPRASERLEVAFSAALRQRGASGVSVQIADLSTTGFRVATHLVLEPGTDVWLRLPGLEPCHARAIWSRGHYVGCQFLRPLHPAVLEMIVRRNSR